jgi:hypothetical protein
MTKAHRFLRRGPDLLSVEIAGVLSEDVSLEFKELFLLVQANLRARKASNGDGEMMRLRAYDKLQVMVRQGSVVKKGKEYRGVAPALATLMQAELAKVPAAAATANADRSTAKAS